MNWLFDFSRYQDEVSDVNARRTTAKALYILRLCRLLSSGRNLGMVKQAGSTLFGRTKNPRNLFNSCIVNNRAVSFIKWHARIQTILTVSTASFERLVKLERISGSHSKLSQHGLSLASTVTSFKEEL
jgi:hypothetical protein